MPGSERAALLCILYDTQASPTAERRDTAPQHATVVLPDVRIRHGVGVAARAIRPSLSVVRVVVAGHAAQFATLPLRVYRVYLFKLSKILWYVEHA